MTLAALIPAYCPGVELTEIVKALTDSKVFDHVIIVDDGSEPEFAPLFVSLQALPRTTLLRHAANLGKGAALKTGINHALVEYPDLIGVVTADADGQHRPKDILLLAKTLQESPGMLIMGTRAFAGDVPLRSRIGNVLTRYIFRFLTGKQLSDTQTGLRGIPMALMRDLLSLRSNRYEFEMDMLILATQRHFSLLEVPIETIYIAENKASHFNPIFDSLRIYFSLLRYSLSSFVTYLVDFAIFYATFRQYGNLLLSQVLARMGAMAVNFMLVRGFVFQAQVSGFSRFGHYAAVVAISGTISYLAQIGLGAVTGVNVVVGKACVEMVLFFANFVILRDVVFVRETQ